MDDARTLEVLKRVSRSKPKEHELCCPECGGEIKLVNGVYSCVPDHFFHTLAELALKK